MKRSGKRRGSAVLIRFMLMIMGLFAGNFFRTIPAFAAEPGDPGQEVWTQDAGSTALDLSEIENYLDRIGEQKTAGMTFGELMNMIQAGDMEKIFLYGRDRIASALFSEIRTNASFLAEILILSLCGAACSGFFGIFGSGQLSETGFYVVCGFTIGAIGVIQTVVSGFLLPVMKLYMVISLVGNLFREEMFSVMTELLGKVVGWTVKTMFGIVVGFHLIQGLVLPQADAMKNAAVMRAVEAVPGVGAGAGVVSDLLLGSAVLIKNTAGAAAVAVLLFLAAVPMVKLTVLMMLYYLAAAVMQPVCDKRLTACITQNAAGHGMLLKIMGYSLALFVVTIAVISYSTNAVYYAG